MNDLPFWLAALIAGFFGSSHCVGMCGGIASVLSNAQRQKDAPSLALRQTGYHLGRISMYVVLGTVLASLTQTVSYWPYAQLFADILRVLAGFMLVLMGLYLGRWWQGLRALEQAAAGFWRHIQPKFMRLGGSTQQNWRAAFAAGALWGLLPCGLVYSAVATAALQASYGQAALFMFLFGLGTVPALRLSSTLAQQAGTAMLGRVRQVGAILLIAFGLWVIANVLGMHGLTPGAEVNQHEHMQHTLPG